jgi:DNA-binding NtrC family response regulator
VQETTTEEEPSRPTRGARFGRLVGGSPAMTALYEEIERAARSWSPVLILGEEGTEVESVAREIHARSPRAKAPFISLDCAQGESPIESELLGHRRGARPWARSDRAGSLVLAGEGTLFLRGLNELTPALQHELTRVLRDGHVTPMGGQRPQEVLCRLVAATHVDLRALVEVERFRADLYYRLDAQRVIVPPLRQRPGDLPGLVQEFSREEPGSPSLQLSAHALKLLASYTWPGNVLELRNEIARLVTRGDVVTAQSLSPEIREGRGVMRSVSFAGLTLGEMESEMLKAALEDCGGNKARAARQLGIPRSTLYHLIERHGL